MPKPLFPAAGGAMPAAAQRRQVVVIRLSTLFTDPFVAEAFRRAEEDGTAPAVAAVEPRKPLQGGTEAAPRDCHVDMTLQGELADA
jgi:hypothetical protein